MSDATIWPVLHYDAPKAIGDFLVGVGFRKTAEVVDDDGDVVHVEVRWPEGGAAVLGSTKHRDGIHGHLRPGTNAAYVVCEDVGAVFTRAEQAGADVIQTLHETAFATGVPTRAFTIRDPENGIWTFGDYRGAAS